MSEVLRDRPISELVEPEARRKLCGGEVLLRIRLASDEIASLTEPAPLFKLTPRLAYLPLHFEELYDHFAACLIPKMGQNYEIWFDYNGEPLKWHFPIGVLCDYLVGTDLPTPLDLTVHFHGTSSTDLLPFSGISDLRRVVENALRQAMLFHRGDTVTWQRLHKNTQNDLWDSICKINLESFATIQRDLLFQSLFSCKSLAVRLHLYGPPHLELLHRALPFVSGYIPATVLSFLQEAMPPLVNTDTGELMEGVQIMTHGMILPVDTPLYWLAINACYLDNFIHLVVRVPSGFSATASSIETAVPSST